MQINFTFLGLNCLATGSVENGHFVADEIAATGNIDDSQLPSALLDELCKAMDLAVDELKVSYVDDTSYFGEQI